LLTLWPIDENLNSCFSLCRFHIFSLKYSELDSFGSSTVPGQLKNIYLFFPNGIVFRYFDYPVIFSNLLAAWNVMLAVKTWYIEVLITKCLTAPLYGKVKVPANYLNVTAKNLIWSRNCSKTCISYIYICR